MTSVKLQCDQSQTAVDNWQVIIDSDIESACMRWLIDNQDDFVDCDESMYGLQTILDYFDRENRLSIDNIIKLAIEMNK